MEKIRYVSVHGGHSGEFCDHARDNLEDIIEQYIEMDFAWVGITEHVPPPTDAQRYPDEIEKGISAAFLRERFARYMGHCRHLQAKYQKEITLFVGFETESWQGCLPYIQSVVKQFRPDYIVGSVHHVDDHCIDYSQALYREAAGAVGGMDSLYCRYFDRQHEMLLALEPAVAGHFDLIRIFDADYERRLKKPEIWQRITRNLACIKALDIALDFNLRALKKGAKEPYVSRAILQQAKKMGIVVIPGDDSHGVADIGTYMKVGMEHLKTAGISAGPWLPPRLYDGPKRPRWGADLKYNKIPK
ncbi:histidinol-phosphatase (PHP family) [Desulfocicer vacuolatum DSM 3385]|uniref:Histidinol-phosphatase n=1 Tax=Desulfocicer vacuolatum DSM 3385 TaxID=1121400 RepID=A0A1W1YKT1_9BACT|nr:histidinol-phosphatase [Desulfocicer vacuolatum]SMC36722.1 histidinol-phosphatase (PHP family) [Desulfocicer vacuolatum DSM 3385]